MAESDKKPKKARDPVVYALSRASRCFHCDAKLAVNDIVKLQNKSDEKEVQCRKCAGLESFAMVPKGDANLTREATKLSPTRFVVMKWSELWKCYEREGILVEQKILDELRSGKPEQQ